MENGEASRFARGIELRNQKSPFSAIGNIIST